MKKSIIINLNIVGLHHWPECPHLEVSYLENLHRHTFFISCVKEVFHSDREIEIIMLRNSIITWLNKTYYSEVYACLNFKKMSCEMIAEKLLNEFKLNFCRVLEDNENGASIRV